MSNPRLEADIFDAVVQLSPAERGAYLDQACAGDAGLRNRIEALLKAVPASDEILKPVVFSPVARIAEQPGDRVGRYKLLQQIGEGGCGVVYMAEQEVPLRRRVALKVIKWGMDTKSVIARFEAERQALALMDHPNIAKVFDAGSTETGRPYFVMELVRGTRITEYCDQQNLTTTARLELFTQVCHAIQHAHQKGIIHRDIKPSNILVTLHDGVPVPKVIDFGIAKATSDQRLTDKTLFTAFEQFIGTPAYMSPEQAEMSGLDIDTRSDIYSLGVLLYELLAGKTPFDGKELLAAGLDEMRRTIREKEPVRPSLRLETLIESDRTEIAKHRQTNPAKLSTLLRGDLDWIVLKALEKHRNRRYETATGFALDIAHHLHNEPVQARPPTPFYRLSRTFRRNRGVFAAGAAVFLSLMVGSGVSAWMFLRERTARKKVMEEKQRSDQRAAVIETVSEFLMSNLLGPSSENDIFNPNFKPKGGESAIDSLARAVSNAGEKFKNQPLVEAKIRQAIGDVYSSFEIKKPELAVPQYERAFALRKAHAGPDDASTLHSMKFLANALAESGRLAEAIAVNKDALTLVRGKHGTQSDEYTMFLYSTADAYDRAGQLEEAIRVYVELVMLTAKDGKTPALEVAFRGKLARAYERQKKFDHAESVLRESVAVTERTAGRNTKRVIAPLKELGIFLLRQQKYEDAEQIVRRCLIIQESEQPELWGTASTRSVLGACLLGQNRFADAEPLLLNGYAGLKVHEEEIPQDRKETIRDALERLVDLYSKWEMPDKAVQWKDNLEAFKRLQEQTNSPSVKQENKPF